MNAPAQVRDGRGRIITLGNLPAVNETRWTARRKGIIVLLVKAGQIERAEIERRYRLGPQELDEWERELAHPPCDRERPEPIELGGRHIALTRLELKIVAFLRGRNSVPAVAHAIGDHLYGPGPRSYRLVEAHINHIRRKLEGTGFSIASICGRGYAWRAPAAQATAA
jgi:DNA-binding response OmpR family regulator